MRVGADYKDGKCRFVVWAPNSSSIDLLLTQHQEQLKMEKQDGGYWALDAEGIDANTQYKYLLDGKYSKPDPASHFQPCGVFGPSQIIDHSEFDWNDSDWLGEDIKNLCFYELHVGTFTPEGTFQSALKHIQDIAEVGFNAVELMPISQFSGSRNWGYDGVFPFGVQNTYGTPNDLKSLINECHKNKIALFIDCVYNHLGPEGNCLNDFAPYFSSDKMGRWGPSINLDGPQNDGVRNFFFENTLYWLGNYHIDGIRLDAVLSMLDSSPNHFLQELIRLVRQFRDRVGRKSHLIAESGYNIPQILNPLEKCGYGFDAQWLDDFQHAIFAIVTGEKEGYYRNYGALKDIIDVLTDAYVYVGGEYDFKRRRPDESYRELSVDKFIVFSQNHDQIGNRLLGDRLTTIAGLEAAKMASAMVFLSNYVPLVFMGEEWGETSPFLFFTDYKSEDLIKSIREGRKHEFEEFHWKDQPPDSQDLSAFEQSKVRWEKRCSETGKKLTLFYKQLIKMRKLPIFQSQAGRQIKQIFDIAENVLLIKKESGNSNAVLIANFSSKQKTYCFPIKTGTFIKAFDSSDKEWAGLGSVLPYKTVYGEEHAIPAFTVAVYLSKPLEGEFVE